jgi:hypothetical protein
MTRVLQLGDRTGIAVAAACALHCLATPVLALSILTAATAERTERALLVASLLLSGTVVATHCLRGGAALLVTPFVLGVPEPIEPVVGVAGSLLIVAAHVIRLAACGCSKEGPVCVDNAPSPSSPPC